MPLPPRGAAASPDRVYRRAVHQCGRASPWLRTARRCVSYPDSDARADDVRGVTRCASRMGLGRSRRCSIPASTARRPSPRTPRACTSCGRCRRTEALTAGSGSCIRRTRFSMANLRELRFVVRTGPERRQRWPRTPVRCESPRRPARRTGPTAVQFIGSRPRSVQPEGPGRSQRVLSLRCAEQHRPRSAALNDRGNALVAWTDGVSAWVRFKPNGEQWQPASSSFARLGLDRDHAGGALIRACNGLHRIRRERVAREPSTRIAGFELLTGWQARAGNDDRHRSRYGVAAPRRDGPVRQRPRRLACGPRRGVFTEAGQRRTAASRRRSPCSRRSSVRLQGARGEPSRVTVTVRGRHLQRHRTSAYPPRRNARCRFGRAVRALLMHHGRYRATIRARDPGPAWHRGREP